MKPADLLELLRSVEWKWDDRANEDICTSCGDDMAADGRGRKSVGHRDDCRLAAAIRGVEAELTVARDGLAAVPSEFVIITRKEWAALKSRRGEVLEEAAQLLEAHSDYDPENGAATVDPDDMAAEIRALKKARP
jgi:hypothetical protein